MAGKDSETDGLSEEERAALEEGEDDNTEGLADIVNEGDDDDGDDDAEAKGGDKTDDKEAKSDEDDDDAEAKGDEEKTGDEEDEEAEPAPGSDAFTPQLNVQQPENFEERMNTLIEEEAALDKKFEDDEIKWADYRAEQRRIQNDQRTLQKEKDDADFAEQQNDTISRQRWLWEVDRFMSDTTDIDYKGDEAMRKALDTAVRVVAQTEEAATMTGREILKEADAWVRAKQGIGKAAANATTNEEADDKTEDDKKKEATNRRKPDMSKVPETLAKTPAAEENETGTQNAKFAELDKLDGLALENALAKLPKAEADEYLASSTG